MIIFKTLADLDQLPITDPARTVIHVLLRQFPRVPESQGYAVLIQSGDARVTLPELESCIAAIGWDGVYMRGNFWIAIRLTNNEFALEFVIPDADWLDADLRASLEASLLGVTYIGELKDPPF